MKIYEIPVYTSYTNLKELEFNGTIFCHKTLLGVKEIVSNDSILVLSSDMIETKNRKKYMKDKSTLHNYLHHKSLKKEGFIPYVLETDLDKAREVSSEEVNDYIENFDISSYHLLCEEAKVNVKSRKN